jgi:ubiquinone/menaquinone biosynthesis C-methylase UbiE
MSEPTEHEQLDRVRERFTRTANVFSGFSLSVRSAEAERLVALTAPEGNETALDLACGPGTFARAFASRVRLVFGVDLTFALLAQARRAAEANHVANLLLVCGNAYAIPLASAALDIASCGYSFHHMSEPAAALRELARVLRAGGRVAVLDLIAPEGSARAERNNQIEKARDVSHTCTLAASELESLVRAAGFRILRREVSERPRSFDDWMRIAGWQPGDPAYAETRRLMEASMENDSAGFHPRWTTGERPDLEFVQTSLFVIAEKR